MEQNLHETTSQWKTYGKRLFSKDLEVRDDEPLGVKCHHEDFYTKATPSSVALAIQMVQHHLGDDYMDDYMVIA
jgi:hypothetical protein